MTIQKFLPTIKLLVVSFVISTSLILLTHYFSVNERIEKSIVDIYKFQTEKRFEEMSYRSMVIRTPAAQEEINNTVVSMTKLEGIVDTCTKLKSVNKTPFMDKDFDVVLAQEVNICAKIGVDAQNKALTNGALQDYSNQMVQAYEQSKYAQLQTTASTEKIKMEYAKLETKASKMANWQ